jgi:hypothetical protein
MYSVYLDFEQCLSILNQSSPTQNSSFQFQNYRKTSEACQVLLWLMKSEVLSNQGAGKTSMALGCSMGSYRSLEKIFFSSQPIR